MNHDEPVQVVVASFKDEQAAERALTGLDQSKRLMDIREAALIRRDEHNKLHIREIRDMGGGRGATIGGFIGAALGLIGGPELAFESTPSNPFGAMVYLRCRDAGLRLLDLF